MSSDSQDFVAVYDEHVWDVYGFLGYRLSSREEVEDLVQATFERALRAWGRFDPERASARTWLLAIAQNLLIDHYRRGSRGAEEPLPEGEPGEAQLGTLRRLRRPPRPRPRSSRRPSTSSTSASAS